MTTDVPFELSSLSEAHGYNRWIASSVVPFLGQRIVEVGAGIGNISLQLPERERLVITEALPDLVAILRGRFREQGRPETGRLSIQSFDLAHDDPELLIREAPDTIVSFNVLEHIPDDAAVVAKLLAILRASRAAGPKRLVSLVPAHAWAFGAMDRVFGHERRYHAGRWRALAMEVAPEAQLTLMPFNPLGLFSWWWNGRVRGRSEISPSTVRTVEKVLPILRAADQVARIARLPLGQSLIAVLEL